LSQLADQLEEIRAAVAELRRVSDGPAKRKQLDSLFRRVHTLKAAAAADGLNDLSRTAHELENLLHSLRTGEATLDNDLLQQLAQASVTLSESLVPKEIWNSLKAEERHSLGQAVKEGANLFLVQTSFDVTDFEQQFLNLKEILSRTGEVVSIAPRVDSEREGKINFRILYASTSEPSKTLDKFPAVSIEELVRQRPASFAEILQRAVRAGQAVALASRKEIDFEVSGQDLSLETSDCEAVANPLLHLIRNAVDHGIEASEERERKGKPRRGKIVIRAERVGEQTTIAIEDDGRGIDPDILPLIFGHGYSTATEVSKISGRGVGLDAVVTELKEIGGSVTATSQVGEGSTFKITLSS
jgi:two-component system, chemotaxis family, sensor kinase CheA